ncbi:MAG: FHA domain-containing protein [Alphaproteobacteria bacterium]|nr:FHA domain-containing protein [Alphaproteobacteria bacterium]
MLLLLAAALAGQGASFVEPPRMDGSFVRTRIRVEDPGTTDAIATQFEFLLDGMPRKARGRRASGDGVTTVLTFDGSGSFRKHHDRAFDLAGAYVSGRLEGEAIGVMVFGRSAESWAPSDDLAVIEANVAAAKQLGATQQETRLAAFVREASEAASTARPVSSGGVRRVVVFTDAGEESRVFDVDEVAAFATSRGVIVDAVVFARGSGSYAEDLDRIARLATMTGGDVIEIHDAEMPTAALGALAQDARTLFDLHVRHCGAAPPSVAVRGPKGIHTDAVTASGQPPACEVGQREDTDDASFVLETREPGLLSPDGPGGRLAGLLCLSLAILVLVLLGVAAWGLASRDGIQQAPPPPAPPPEPPDAPSGEQPTPAEPPAAPADGDTENSAFSMHLPETHLRVVGGDLPRGTRWRFAGRILRVGASAEDNEVVVDLPQISSRHARFELFPSGAVYVEDLGSSNGTWVAQKRLRPNVRTEVPHGASVALSSQLVVVVDQPHRGEA